MQNSTVLIVDDDYNICDLVRMYLEKEGFKTEIATDGKVAIEKFKYISPQLIVLDLMLPGIDGLEVCREIRKQSSVPIIMLTAKDDTLDKVLGLEMGADDYMAKPFEPRELVARVKAVLRRSVTPDDIKKDEVTYNNLVINKTNYVLKINGETIEMPPKELEVLYYLAANPGKVFTRDQLLDEIWGYEFYGDSRTVDVHIKRIREKIEKYEDGWSLKTVWGVGYKFEVKPSAQ